MRDRGGGDMHKTTTGRIRTRVAAFRTEPNMVRSILKGTVAGGLPWLPKTKT